MATGALVGQVCYATQAQANDAYYSQYTPNVTPGDLSYYSAFQKVGDGWTFRTWKAQYSSTTLWADVVAPVMTFPSCDTLSNFKDGQTLGWGVVIAMVAAWCVVNLKKGVL